MSARYGVYCLFGFFFIPEYRVNQSGCMQWVDHSLDLKQIVTKVLFKSLSPGLTRAPRVPALAARAAGGTSAAEIPVLKRLRLWFAAA